MERIPVILDRKDYRSGSDNHHLNKSNLCIQCKPNQNPTQFFAEPEVVIPDYIWKKKTPRKTHIILNNKRTLGGIPIPDLKLY